jgi:hypothetical protein
MADAKLGKDDVDVSYKKYASGGSVLKVRHSKAQHMDDC